MTDEVAIEIDYFDQRPLAQLVADLWVKWDGGRRVWKDKVKEVIQYVYATSTKETSNVSNGWSHTTHIPKLTQIYDNLGANYKNALFSNRQFLDFEPSAVDTNTAAQRKAVVAYLLTKCDDARFKATIKKLLDDWVQTGNCFCKLEYVRETVIDRTTKEEVTVFEGPLPIRISPYDIVFDHTALSFDKTPKIVRSIISRGELDRMVREHPSAEYDLNEIQACKDFASLMSGMVGADADKVQQAIFDGFASTVDYYASGKLEVLEMFGDIYDPMTQTLHENVVITVVDRRFVIRNQSLDSLGQFGDIYHSGWRKRPDNLWAMGPLDNLVGLQYYIDHLENARADAFDQMLAPDRVHVGNVQVKQNGPVTNYYVDDAKGDVRNLAPDATALNADFQIERKEIQMESYAGAPREALGIRSPGEKTAFEVERLDNAGQRLFQHKIEQFEEDCLERMFNGMLELGHRNLNSTDIARTIDDDFGVEAFLNITKEDLRVRGKLKARGASHFAKKALLQRELQNFANVLQTDPGIAVHFPAQARAKAWNDALSMAQYDLYLPFGQLAENVELNRKMQAAQMVADRDTATAQEAQENPVV